MWLQVELAMEYSCELNDGYFAGSTTREAVELVFPESKQEHGKMVSMIVPEGLEDEESLLRHVQSSLFLPFPASKVNLHKCEYLHISSSPSASSTDHNPLKGTFRIFPILLSQSMLTIRSTHSPIVNLRQIPQM